FNCRDSANRQGIRGVRPFLARISRNAGVLIAAGDQGTVQVRRVASSAWPWKVQATSLMGWGSRFCGPSPPARLLLPGDDECRFASAACFVESAKGRRSDVEEVCGCRPLGHRLRWDRQRTAAVLAGGKRLGMTQTSGLRPPPTK